MNAIYILVCKGRSYATGESGHQIISRKYYTRYEDVTDEVKEEFKTKCCNKDFNSIDVETAKVHVIELLGGK